MHAQDFIINKACNRQAVEYILEFLPDSDTVTSFAFIIEAIDSIDLSTLVVSSEHEEIFFVLDFVS